MKLNVDFSDLKLNAAKMLGLKAYLSELAIQEKTYSECMELAKSFVLTNNGAVIAENKEGPAILELNKVIAHCYKSNQGTDRLIFEVI